MSFDEINDQSIYEDLSKLIASSRPYISKEGGDLAFDYIEHDEPELAFEALFLSLMKVNYLPASLDKNKWRSIGKYLHLDGEGVLDADFWSKFLKFLGDQKS